MVETLIGNPVAFALLVAGLGALIYAVTVREKNQDVRIVSDSFYKDIDLEWEPSSQEEKWLKEIGYMKLISERNTYLKSVGVYYKYGEKADLTVYYHFVSRHFNDGIHYYSTNCTNFRGINTKKCTGKNGLSETDISVIEFECRDFILTLVKENFDVAMEDTQYE